MEPLEDRILLDGGLAEFVGACSGGVDPSLSATGAASATVNQILSRVTVTPASTELGFGGLQQFSATAYDQFGDAMASQPAFTWFTTVGAITGDGLLTAPSMEATGEVIAAADGVRGTSAFTVVPTDWAFLVFSDSQGTSASYPINDEVLSDLASHMATENAQFTLFLGDLTDVPGTANYPRWQSDMAPLFNTMGVCMVAGNHEALDVAEFKSTFIAPLEDSPFPGEKDFTLDSSAEDGRSYAFNYQNALFLGLDNYAGGSDTAHAVNQTFLDARLAARDAGTTPLVIVFDHEPAFKVGPKPGLEAKAADRDEFWNSLKTAGVRSFFAGHSHLYSHERLQDNPDDGNPDNDVHQVIVATAGSPLRSYTPSGDTGDWTRVDVYHEEQYGYLRVHVHGNTVTQTWVHRTEPGVFSDTSEVFSYEAYPTFSNSSPTVLSPAHAWSDPVTGAPTALSVLGQDDAGESTLTYSWTASELPLGAAPPTWSANGTNAAKDTLATFSAAGTYGLTVVITDAGGLSTVSTLSVVVNQTLASIDVDGNGTADALTDGILILRYLFDPSGPWSYTDALGSGAARTTRTAIRSFLDGGQTTVLDVDGNGTADPLTDGILILRYLFDRAGPWNYSDAVGNSATRTDREAIRAYLDQFDPSSLLPRAPGRTGAAPVDELVGPSEALMAGLAWADPALDPQHAVVHPVQPSLVGHGACPRKTNDPLELRTLDAVYQQWSGTGRQDAGLPLGDARDTDGSLDEFYTDEERAILHGLLWPSIRFAARPAKARANPAANRASLD